MILCTTIVRPPWRYTAMNYWLSTTFCLLPFNLVDPLAHLWRWLNIEIGYITNRIGFREFKVGTNFVRNKETVEPWKHWKSGIHKCEANMNEEKKHHNIHIHTIRECALKVHHCTLQCGEGIRVNDSILRCYSALPPQCYPSGTWR